MDEKKEMFLEVGPDGAGEDESVFAGFRAQHDRERRLVHLRLKWRVGKAQLFEDLVLTPEQACSLAAGVDWAPELPETETVKRVCPRGHVDERPGDVTDVGDYCEVCFVEWAQEKFPRGPVEPEEPK